ncbi:protein kinase domain-containing protein [Chamaesiphon sp. OTE_20_metabat_361]|uniref:protein kinase domain-containing protein n=1 Tax=Chamaesiphon sp. OTE_20_metabat_361 TaxID=2964689 RepID=UPI00286A9289|nr:ankyrin repeat domain-containing protein [Chamaesiphon sp. OTE_20_metabat_361]
MKSATHPSQVIARSGTAEAVCYDILGILGEGGSGVTYRAVDSQTRQPVALKALSLDRMNDWKAIELFEREAKVLSALDRDGIPKYLDYFTTDIDDERYFYIVQELAPGKTLLEWMRSGWRVTEAELKPIIIQILKILIYLHRHYPPIVHRDLKPSNILKTDDGKIYLVDFGAVQQTYHDTFMRGSTVVGTYGYMAPEQFRGQAVPATDLYGLGATILHLLTHRSPAEIPQDGLRLNFRDRLQVSNSFADWLERMLEPDVGSRFSSSTKALEVFKNPPKSKKFKPTFSKFDRALIGAIGLASLLLVFGVFDRSKYYWLSIAGLVANEPFEAMSRQPNVSQIRGYLDRGFNVDTKDRHQRTLMSHAIDNDLPEVVQMLIERGADIRDSANLVPPQQEKLKSIQEQKKNLDRDAVQEASGSSDPSYVSRAKQYKQYQINLQEKEAMDTNLNGILYYAIRKNRIGVLELLLRRGVSLNRAYPDQNKLSLLHLASVHQDGEIVKLLLDRGVDPNIQDSLGCTPLHTAIVRDLMPYTPKLSKHINNIANNPISKQAIFYLVQAGAKSDARCYFSRGEYRNNFYYPGGKIDSVAKLVGSKTSNSSNTYEYSSPAQLLLFLGITDINLNSADRKK